jgi:BON domain
MKRSALRLGTVFMALTLLSACNLINSIQGPDDKAIVSDIQAKLYQDPTLKTRDVQVVSQKGVVVLTGTVSTDLEKSAAERLAGEVKGVKQVINQLTVSSAPAAGSAAPEPVANTASNPPPAPERTRERASKPSHRRAEKPQAAQPAPADTQAASQPPPAAPAPPEVAETAPPPPPPEPVQITVPSGSVVSVRMIDGIDSSKNRPGEEFAASIAAPVVVGNRVVIPQGSDARVRLVQAASAGHMTGRSELQVELIQVTVDGAPHNVRSSVYEQAGASRGKRTAETVGGGAALGALIGAIAGKGKGAAIGAAIGAGAGTGVQAATKGQQIKIPPETKIDFTLKTPIQVTMNP